METERERMVSLQLEGRGIEDPRVLTAMRLVPRHEFVPPELAEHAYLDEPLPIGEGQTISQPYIVALMTEALQLREGERVLEIGSGSGYQSAVLATMGAEVFTIERLRSLAEWAQRRLQRLGYDRVHVRCSDGNDGWSDAAPFDAVLITAAAREIPRGPLQQLEPLGRMVLPIGDEEAQQLVRVWRTEGGFKEDYLGGCRFVKLIGRHGWEG
jgi:protein-L-isoaspartate(D-aspartate) O-methyltransferase